MGHKFRLGCFMLLVAAVIVEAQETPPRISIHSKCLGNIMRIDVGPLGGKVLEISGVINNTAILLTPQLTTYCGFSMKGDRQGNVIIYASIQNCFAQNMQDKSFTTALYLRVYGTQPLENDVYQMAETCSYTKWASREIICDRNYMEVSVRRAAPGDYILPRQALSGVTTRMDPRRVVEKRSIDKGFKITTVVFFTPTEKIMTVTEAQGAGYEIVNTPTRLMLRTSKTAPELYVQHVRGVNMIVLKTSMMFEKNWQVTRINAAAACPLQQGSVSFTPYRIVWILPRSIDPLISTTQPRLLEAFLGIDGQRLRDIDVANGGFSMTVEDTYVIVEILVGAVGGYFQDGQTFKTYTIEPMLEMLWTEGANFENTRYKVFFPLVIPLPQIVDNTIASKGRFKVSIGPFSYDVALMNITFSSGILLEEDLKVRGFNIQEHGSHNGTLKYWTLQVPFTDGLVLQLIEDGYRIYSLYMTVGFTSILAGPFAFAVHLEARLLDIVSPFISGSCDHDNFYVLVKYGTQGGQFETLLGKRPLSPHQPRYNFRENGTHFSITVPFSSPEVVFESIQGSSIRSRLDVTLKNLQSGKRLKDFSLTCHFYSTLTECFPNGTITALAVKVESVPSLNPDQLTLRDPTCGPRYSNHRLAHFVFTANSCGTRRKFFPNVMRYDNVISLPDHLDRINSESEESEYELTVICYYEVNTSYSLGFHTRARRSQPYAETAKGKLHIEMRLALDKTYSAFHRVEDYPLTKFLSDPLYFEVELMTLTNPQVSLELENCWATVDQDGTSQPRWNLIINGCANPVDPQQVLFHSVWVDARVKYPSHFKRFEVRTFSFMKDQDTMSPQVFVHCDVVICDSRNPQGGVCSGQCSTQNEGHTASQANTVNHVSSGPIHLNY